MPAGGLGTGEAADEAAFDEILAAFAVLRVVAQDRNLREIDLVAGLDDLLAGRLVAFDHHRRDTARPQQFAHFLGCLGHAAFFRDAESLGDPFEASADGVGEDG